MREVSLEVATAPEAPAAGSWPSPARAWYAAGVLSLALLFATIDRSILSLLVEPIKADLGISDTRMGLLIGGAFVVLHAFLGLPIARLADVHSRRLIIGIGIALWSSMTALFGAAQSYWQLFLARAGVGAGEAAFAPAAYSILTDSFPPQRLPRAMALVSLGFATGTGLAYLVGGTMVALVSDLPEVTLPLLGTVRTWQMVFFAVGLPGLLVALLMATVREPRRRGLISRIDPAGAASAPRRALPVRQIAAFLWEGRHTYLPIFASMGIKTLLSFGTGLWLPAFFMRTYGWTVPQIGVAQGLVTLTAAPLGLAVGGWLAEWYAKRGYDDANMRVVLLATIGVVPFTVVFPLMPDAGLALALYAASVFVASVGIPPGNAALQIITPNEMRGQVRALYQFIFNIVGFALGPIFVGVFTDYVFGEEASLRYSLATAATIIGPLSIAITWYGLRPYGRSVARARAWA